MNRDSAWAEAQRSILASWSLARLCDFIRWNEHGNEDLDGITHDEALDCVMRSVDENMETPDEMRRGSRS